LYEAALYIVRLIILIRMRRPLTYSIRKAFGYSNLTWNVDALIGVALLLLAFAVELFAAKPVAIKSLSMENILVVVQQDPLGSSAILLAFASSFFLSSFLIDRVKRIFAGRDYDEAVEKATPESNLLLWNDLKKAVEGAKEELEQISEEEMDVGAQLSKLMAIPLDSLKEEIYSNPDQDSIKKRIRKYLEKVSGIVESVHHKSELAKENKGSWIAYIDKKIGKADTLPLDALVSIPIEWRFWAAKEYIKEHPERFVTLEGTLLIKHKFDENQRAAEFIKRVSEGLDGSVLAAAVVKDSKLLASTTSLEKKSLMDNFFIMLSQRLINLSSTRAIAFSKNHLIYTNVFNNKRIILLAHKKAFEEISNRVTKFSSLL
ncbi:MAG: hypothetical protein D6769_02890, partial [Methanobacteriota archaeon]